MVIMMTHRAHLLSFTIASAIRDVFKEGYSSSLFVKDLIAGITVGIVSTPVSLALAIACGVPPQHGLYTAMIGGFIIALLGGSRYSVSGPTAAFVVILYPITQQFGLEGLLLATMLSGIILIAMSIARLGRLIEYIPESVTLGFTLGIAVVLATLQIKDFFGLPLHHLPSEFYEKAILLFQHVKQLNPPDTLIGLFTLATLIIWPRFKTRLPAQLPALLLGIGLSLWLTNKGYFVETISSRFHYMLPSGETVAGIPPFFPEFTLPWKNISFTMVSDILPSAFSIALLAAIESLLCAVILDRMSNTRHHSNSELFAQGIGNLVVPFFGGITATSAIARSVTNYRAGAQTPIAAMLQAIFVLFATIGFSKILGILPMASISAILLMVAWSMGEPHKVFQMIRRAPIGDILVFSTCLFLTIFFDMVIAIGVGVILSSLFFMRDISRMTKVSDITHDQKHVNTKLNPEWAIYKISGPLFFAAADSIFSELALLSENKKGIIIHMEGVSLLDAGGVSAMTQFFDLALERKQRLIISDLQFQPLKTMAKAGIMAIDHQIIFMPTLKEACHASHYLEQELKD